MVATTLALALGWRLWATLAPTSTLGPPPFALGNWWAWPFAHAFAWVLGALVAEHHAGVIRLPNWLRSRSALTLALAAALATSPDWFAHAGPWTIISEPLFALAFAVWLGRWIERERSMTFPAWLVGLGTISYSLYLVHLPVIWQYDGRFTLASPWADLLLRFVVLPPACLGGAYGFYQLIERRFLPRPRGSEPPR